MKREKVCMREFIKGRMEEKERVLERKSEIKRAKRKKERERDKTKEKEQELERGEITKEKQQ